MDNLFQGLLFDVMLIDDNNNRKKSKLQHE